MKPKLLDLFCKAGGCSHGYALAGFEVIGCDKESQKRYPYRLIVADALKLLEMKRFISQFDAIHASPPCQLHSSLAHLPNFKPEKHEDLIAPVRELLKASGKPYIIENVPGAPLIEPFTLCGTMFGLRTDCGAELRRHRLFETNWFDDLLCMPQCQHYADRSIGVTGTGNAMTGARQMNRDNAVHGGRGHDRVNEQRKRTISVNGDSPRDTALEKQKYCVKRTVTGNGHSANDWGQIRQRRRSVTVSGHGTPGFKDEQGRIRETFPIEQARKAMGISWMTGKELSQAIPPAYTRFIGERLLEYLSEKYSIAVESEV